LEPISDAARLAWNAAERLAESGRGYLQVHELMVAWSQLSKPDSAIARALSRSETWPDRNELARAMETATDKISSTWLEIMTLYNRSRSYSIEAGANALRESHLVRALIALTPQDINNLGVRVDDWLAEVERSEQPQRHSVSPLIFVGYPWNVHPSREAYKNVFVDLAKIHGITFLFAEDQLISEHLLKKIQGMIERCAFAVFDISIANPNVSLELGLARGMGKRAYIAFNPKLLKEEPADVRGFDSIRYTTLEQLRESLARLIRQELDR
jgi:hypothetical protein